MELKADLLMPTTVATVVDVGRLLREVGALEDFMDQTAIRQPGTSMQLPKTSRLLDAIVDLNKLNMLQQADRHRLYIFLEAVKQKAPVLHISFSADPSPYFMQKVVTYLRTNIHPVVLVQVGLQPNIGAGCVVRSTNKYFDFSLRQRLKSKRDVLLKTLQSSTVRTPEGVVNG